MCLFYCNPFSARGHLHTSEPDVCGRLNTWIVVHALSHIDKLCQPNISHSGEIAKRDP